MVAETYPEYFLKDQNSNLKEKAFKTAEKKKSTGMISLIEYYEVKNELANSKVEVLRTSLQLFIKTMYVEFYINGDILN